LCLCAATHAYQLSFFLVGATLRPALTAADGFTFLIATALGVLLIFWPIALTGEGRLPVTLTEGVAPLRVAGEV
jgi:hypothetical protein